MLSIVDNNAIMLTYLIRIKSCLTRLVMIIVVLMPITYVKFEQIQTCFGRLEISFRYHQYFLIAFP